MKKTKISSYTPDPENANVHSERGIGMLETSISQTGLGRSIVVDKNGYIIAGNSTQERAIDQGFEDAIEVETDGNELVVVRRKDLDLLNDPEHRARLHSVLDNRAAETGIVWQPETLESYRIQGVPLDKAWTPVELDGLGVGQDENESHGDPGAAISRAEELRDKYDVQNNQLWIVGNHRILCGDAYSQDDRDLLLDGQSPVMLHIDPPYGINIVKPKNGRSTADSGGAKPFGSTAPANRKGDAAVAERNSGKVGGGRGDESSRHARAERVPVQHGSPSKNQWSKNHPEYMTIKGDVGRGDPANIVQSNLYPVIEGDDRPFEPEQFLDIAPITIMWGANYFADRLPTSSCWICWDKREDITRNNFADGELAWTNMDKPMRVFHHLWNGLHKGSQWGEARTHPTEKPVALFEEIGKMYCPDGLWLDLFAGTGAQVVAAERVGVACYACEIEPLYVATIIERLSQMGLEARRVE